MTEQAIEEECEPQVECEPTVETVSLPEAGGVAWIDLHGRKKDTEGNYHPVKISLTSRAATPIVALRGLVEAIKFAEENYKLTTYMQTATAVKNAQPVAQPAPVIGAPALTNLPGEPIYAPVAAAAQQFSFQCVRLEVTPQPGGKTKVGFYGNDKAQPVNKYPTLNAVKTPPQLAAMMGSAWTEAHFSAPALYDVNLTCVWKNGNVNPKGGFYKDIVSVG